MKRFSGLCAVLFVCSGLGACGSKLFGDLLESEGIAAPAKSSDPDPQLSPKTAKGYPQDDDAPTEVPRIDGYWTSNWGKPLYFQQHNEWVSGQFDNGGRMECRWNGKSRFNCTWNTRDGASGLAQVWWEGDGPVGHWAAQKNLKEWGSLEFVHYTPKPVAASSSGSTSSSRPSTSSGSSSSTTSSSSTSSSTTSSTTSSSPSASCSSIGDSDERHFCNARTSNNKNACSSIRDDDKRRFCGAVVGKNKNECSSIRSDDLRKRCQAEAR